jgi:hypothetical protein
MITYSFQDVRDSTGEPRGGTFYKSPPPFGFLLNQNLISYTYIQVVIINLESSDNVTEQLT